MRVSFPAPSRHGMLFAGMADVVAVNSKFTAGIFKAAFSRAALFHDPAVLYPSIDLSSFTAPVSSDIQEALGACILCFPVHPAIRDVQQLPKVQFCL